MPVRKANLTTVVGTGKLARALTPLLGPAGFAPRAVVGRRIGAARAVCRGLRGVRSTTSLRKGVDAGHVVLLAVDDRAVEATARRMAALAGIDWAGRAVLHHAGALGCEPLEPLRRVGAAVGLLHPLQSLGDAALTPQLLSGSRARVDGDRRGRALARRLALGLGLVPLPLRTLTADRRDAYHAAASLAANDLVALLSLGTDLLESSGLGRRQALDALLPLVRGVLLQLERRGWAGPLTGPAARGDVATLRRHLRALRRIDGDAARIHRLLSLRLARLARDLGVASATETLAGLSGSKPGRGV